MDHDTQRITLLKALLDDNPQYRHLEIPTDSTEQKQLIRALMNIRMPEPISQDILDIQDAYLQEEQGDMTTLKVDAIVNPANSAMLGCFRPLHNCVDNIIHSKAGIQLRLACNDYMTEQAQKYGENYEEPTGQAMITKGYNLPAHYVIHTVGPIISGILTKKDEDLLASCYKECLTLASNHNLTSIAFPCISTGVFRFPQDKAAKVAVKAVQEWLDACKDTSLQKIIFNVFKDEDYHYYDQLLNKRIPYKN
ncbi:macro domain-containing protein [Sharpea azabuensis]|uniref:macro domain-containing protein n=2 Tax=Sharpea azabuensis TaxID=322505 RepID=UPI001568D564|nr:macro domain-containing protein [Sharpea azabuensis]